MTGMEWEIVYYSDDLQQAILELPAGLQARYLHLTQRQLAFGPDLGLPHTRAMGEGPVRVATQGEGGDRQSLFLHPARPADHDAPRLRQEIGQDAGEGAEDHPQPAERGTSTMMTHKELTEKMLAQPAVRAEYEAQAEEYALLDELLTARHRAGLTQAEVARRMGTKTPAVARLEAGGGSRGHSPSVATLRKYAHAVGCRLEIRLVPCNGQKSRPVPKTAPAANAPTRKITRKIRPVDD
jgi:transcriptional regulator with XRE-family HTH domain